jgi:cell division protein FtsQ
VFGLDKNLVSLEDRIPKLKQMRKKKANRRLIGLLAIFFLLIFSIIYLQSPLSRIQSIRVEGNTYLTDQEIIKQSGLEIDDNIWEIKSGKIEAAIKKHTEIKDVTLQKEFPNHIKIKINEYEYTAYVQKGKEYYPVLSNGKILDKKLQHIPDSGPLLVSFKEGKPLAIIIKQLEEMPEDVMNSISEIHHNPSKTDKTKVTLYMNDGYEVTASGETLADKLVHYAAIVSQLEEGSKGIIDLEVGSYFRSYKTDLKSEE